MASQVRRPVFAGTIGNILEWYDFAVFGFLAPFIASQFFPSDDPLSGLINTFGVFAGGYLVRPIGGVVFGWIGDRVGRKRALQISIVAMALPTTLIAFLPTHAEVGVLAPALLVALRLAQGLSVGGEFIGSVCYMVESAPPGRRGFHGSFAMFGAIAGMLLGSAIAALIHGLLPLEQIQDWGWRLPFLGGLVVGAVGWWMRQTLPESREFGRLAEAGDIAASPVAQAVRETPLRILQVGGVVMLLGVAVYTLFVWMPTYLTRIVQPAIPHALLINTLALALMAVSMPVFGRLGDRLGYKTLLGAASLVVALVVYPLFRWIDGGSLVAVIVAMASFAILNGCIQGNTAVAIADLIPARLRFSGLGIGYNITLALFGGTAPLVATWLIKATGSLAAPGIYLAVVAVVTLIAVATIQVPRRAAGNDP
jgi:MHS family proline/betaine transporter-like MFS transporter